MAEKKQPETTKIDALYSWLSYDIQKMKTELLKEMKYSSVQVSSLYQSLQADKDKSSQAISQEIRYSYKQNQTIYDGLATMLTHQVGARLSVMEETSADVQAKQAAIETAVADILAKMEVLLPQVTAQGDTLNEKVDALLPAVEESIRYGQMQQQAIYDSLSEEFAATMAKLGDMESKVAMLEALEQSIAALAAKVEEGFANQNNADYQSLIESVAEQTEACVNEHNRQVLDAVNNVAVQVSDAVANISVENVDYNRIVDEVGDKVLELLGEVGLNEPAPVVAPSEPVDVSVDYDKIIYGTAEKVVESLPYPEKVDYTRIEETMQKAVASAVETAVNTAMEKMLAAFDIDAIANAVAQKIQVPAVESAAVDYDLLSDMVAEKLAANNEQTYDVVLDETGVDQIAEKVSEKMGAVELDYDRIAAIVEEKLSNVEKEDPTYEVVLDEDGVQTLAKSVSEEICQMCANCTEEVEVVEEVVEEQPVEEVIEEQPVEEVVEEVVEEQPVEEVVEEVVEEQPVEEVVEEVVEEQPVEEVVEEVVEEQPVEETVAPVEELAVADAEPGYDELNDQLVDAETGLVIRLKKSFTAKLKQSDDKVKEYYSDLKNELVSYKRINSNISWHGDRFNFGRDTVAKVNICGKTLCFYIALDPEDPEYKTTVYHQKNVGNQKAYESTPFMVKVKSDAAAKKALRLVGYLADKLGTTKEEEFEEVNYVEQFGYETTKQLYEAGLIKATKEKKVELDF